jgi:hypothetical protein
VRARQLCSLLFGAVWSVNAMPQELRESQIDGLAKCLAPSKNLARQRPKQSIISVVPHSTSTDGYFASTVGKHGDETTIGKYVKNQGNEYQKLHSGFDW